VGPGIAGAGFSRFTIYLERVEDGFMYDEAKRLVPNKAFGGNLAFIPVFPSWPR
jgi:hypothetical protein